MSAAENKLQSWWPVFNDAPQNWSSRPSENKKSESNPKRRQSNGFNLLQRDDPGHSRDGYQKALDDDDKIEIIRDEGETQSEGVDDLELPTVEEVENDPNLRKEPANFEASVTMNDHDAETEKEPTAEEAQTSSKETEESPAISEEDRRTLQEMDDKNFEIAQNNSYAEEYNDRQNPKADDKNNASSSSKNDSYGKKSKIQTFRKGLEKRVKTVTGKSSK